MTKQKLADMKTKLKELLKEQKQYVKARDKYYNLNHKIDKLKSTITREGLWNELEKIGDETNYTECDYPYMGGAGCNGEATLEQANNLIDVLRKNGGYTLGYLLEWDGSGKYTIIPSYSYDHDGDIVYLATFKRRIK